MKLLKILAVVFVVLVVLPILVVLGVGMAQPVDHVASSRATYAAPPSEVWSAIADFESWPAWNSAFDTVERLPDVDGHPAWRFDGGFGEMPMAVTEVVEGQRMVTRIPEDAGIGYHGTWTYVVEADGAGTRVTVTEDGSVPSVLFRGVGALFFDHHMAMNAFLVDLGGRFGETIEPQELDPAG